MLADIYFSTSIAPTLEFIDKDATNVLAATTFL